MGFRFPHFIAIGWLSRSPVLANRMLSENSSSPVVAPQLALFQPQPAGPQPTPPIEAPCSVSAEFLQVFEQLTGWQAEFEESIESLKRRRNPGSESIPAEGEFKIVDMSPNWPAKTPTAHRGKSDQLVRLFGQLMTELQATRGQLQRANSTLEALSPGTVHQEAEVVDAFVPKFSLESERDPNVAQVNLPDLASAIAQTQSNDDDFTLADDLDDDFVVHQSVSDIGTGSSGAWKNWQVGGTTGIAQETYLDWFLNENNLSICVGRIESSFGIGDSETAIEINPEACQYRVFGDQKINAFYVWDRRGGQMTPVDHSGEWINLPPAAAVIAATTSDLQTPDPEAELSRAPTAEQLATVISRHLETDDKVFVIKRK